MNLIAAHVPLDVAIHLPDILRDLVCHHCNPIEYIYKLEKLELQLKILEKEKIPTINSNAIINQMSKIIFPRILNILTGPYFSSVVKIYNKYMFSSSIFLEALVSYATTTKCDTVYCKGGNIRDFLKMRLEIYTALFESPPLVRTLISLENNVMTELVEGKSTKRVFKVCTVIDTILLKWAANEKELVPPVDYEEMLIRFRFFPKNVSNKLIKDGYTNDFSKELKLIIDGHLIHTTLFMIFDRLMKRYLYNYNDIKRDIAEKNAHPIYYIVDYSSNNIIMMDLSIKSQRIEEYIFGESNNEKEASQLESLFFNLLFKNPNVRRSIRQNIKMSTFSFSSRGRTFNTIVNQLNKNDLVQREWKLPLLLNGLEITNPLIPLIITSVGINDEVERREISISLNHQYDAPYIYQLCKSLVLLIDPGDRSPLNQRAPLFNVIGAMVSMKNHIENMKLLNDHIETSPLEHNMFFEEEFERLINNDKDITIQANESNNYKLTNIYKSSILFPLIGIDWGDN